MNLSIGIAFLAGTASFFSPCVFSLVPAYIGYLGGRSMATPEGVTTSRWSTFTHGVAFVLGFSIVFIALGVAISALGGLLYDVKGILAKVGGLIVIVFGLHLTGILRIPFLEYDLRPQTKMDERRSYFSSALMGLHH
jgi:cytochrome c-type biogenesis protein